MMMTSLLHRCRTHRALTRLRLPVLLLALSVQPACSIGPAYHKPDLALPPNYKEDPGWKVATPNDGHADAKWWELYGDNQLNQLEEQLVVSNQDIKLAIANHEQAEALAREVRASYFPTLALQGQETHSHNQLNKLSGTQVSRNLSLTAAWEPDLWGQLRQNAEAAETTAQASAAELASATLSARSTLAINYFQWCSLDIQIELYNSTLEAYRKVSVVTESRYRAGIAAKSDVLQADTQRETAHAQLLATGLQRSKLEHAMALLLGKSPAEFSVASCTSSATLPVIPPSLPGQLLERRPDIAAAERRVASANAQIGVQETAYFPLFSLSGSAGFQGINQPAWISAPNRLWSLSAAVSETLFDAGARNARVAAAKATWEGTVASYRQTVLTAFQEVEDNLAAQRILADEFKADNDAAQSAQQNLDIVTHRYRSGVASALDVANAQEQALASARNANNARAQQLVASVSLITALGGLWNDAPAENTAH